MTHEELSVGVGDLAIALGQKQLGVEIGPQNIGPPGEFGPHCIPDFSGDILGNESLGNFLRGLPFEEKSETEFHLLTSEPKLYKVKLKFDGIEEITVPAGTFKCFKTELVPELGLLGSIAKRFIPKTYFWHSVSYPRLWVQYEGLESGLKTPHVIMQLTEFEMPEKPEGGESQR